MKLPIPSTGNRTTVCVLKKISLFIIIAIAFAKNSASAQSVNPKLSILLLLNLNGGNQNTADGVVTVFSEKFSSGIGLEDSYKFSNSAENLAINRNGTLLSIEGRPIIATRDSLPLKMWKFRQKHYFLKFDGSGFSNGVSAIVTDAYLNIETSVSLGTSTIIPFDITADSASFNPSRFTIHIKTNSAEQLLPVTFGSTRAYKSEKGINVDWVTLTEVNVEKYFIEKSVDGQTFSAVATMASKLANTAFNNYTWLDASIGSNNNFYRIRAVEKSGVEKYSQIVRVTSTKINSGISVFPNPSRGNTLSLQFSNVENGKYTMNLYNLQGQVVYKGSVEYSGNTRGTQTITIPQSITGGTYRLQMANQNAIISSKVVFLVK